MEDQLNINNVANVGNNENQNETTINSNENSPNKTNETNKDPVIVTNSRKSRPYLSKYEFAKVLGSRSQQLANGAQPTIIVPKNVTDTTQIAILELKERKCPLKIERTMPSGLIESWSLNELIYDV